MTAHKHAHLMAQYAQDAAETETPWERWQCLRRDDKWRDMRSHPAWYEANEYRRKPRTILINGFEVPEPMRKAPEDGTEYWVLCLPYGVSQRYVWPEGGEMSREWIRQGLCHLTPEAARQHAEALISLSRR